MVVAHTLVWAAHAGSTPTASPAAQQRPRLGAPLQDRDGHANRPKTPPKRSRGAAYSSTTGWDATARATTRSLAPMPSDHCSARAQTTSTFSSHRPPPRLRQIAHLRAWLSTSRDLSTGQSHREREPWEACTRADVGYPGRGSYHFQFKCHERVRQMNVERLRRITHSRRGKLIGRQRRQDRPRVGRPVQRQTMTSAKFLQQRPRVALANHHAGSSRLHKVTNLTNPKRFT